MYVVACFRFDSVVDKFFYDSLFEACEFVFDLYFSKSRDYLKFSIYEVCDGYNNVIQVLDYD